MDISQRADCNNMSSYDYQRQTYVWNYLDGSQRGDMCDKPKVQSPVAECYSATDLDENQTLQMKTPSIYNLSRENAQRSMAVTNWGSPIYPRHGLSHCEAARGYSENASPSCMFSAPRVHYQHYVNHARSQFEWIHDLTQDPTMRSRPSFTSHQTRELEREFANCQYISRRRRIEIAYSLNLSEKQIKTWFQNRRVKERKTRKPPESK